MVREKQKQMGNNLNVKKGLYEVHYGLEGAKMVLFERVAFCGKSFSFPRIHRKSHELATFKNS